MTLAQKEDTNSLVSDRPGGQECEQAHLACLCRRMVPKRRWEVRWRSRCPENSARASPSVASDTSIAASDAPVCSSSCRKG